MRDLYFAEFYRRGTGKGKWRHAAGPTSVCILDGRRMMANLKVQCANECRTRGYDGYRIARGKFITPAYLTPKVVEVA